MEKEIELEQEAIVVYSGGGAVNSVNGYTGDVVLTTSDLENTSDYQTGTEVESAIAGKQDTLTAGANIQINNNTISATDTTYSAFTGTDGTAAGTAGLVPAPATTDAGKFLKADGTWDTAGGGGGALLSEEFKEALLDCFENVAWATSQGQTYYDALYDALYESKTLVSISAVFNQGQTVIYDNASLDDLKQYLTVTALYDDSSTAIVTSYSLSGTLTVGTSTITVTYQGKTTTFTVTVTASPTVSSIDAVYTQSGDVYTTDTLDSLKSDLVVTATYADSSTRVVTDYTLSGTLTAGTSTITVTYEGKIDTFDVLVEAGRIPSEYQEVEYVQYNHGTGGTIAAEGDIDTNFAPTKTSKMVVTMASTNPTAPSNNLFGIRDGSIGADNAFRITSFSSAGKIGFMRWGYSNQGISYDTNFHTYVLGEDVATIDGTSYSMTSPKDQSSTKSIHIFSEWGGSTQIITAPQKMKDIELYSDSTTKVKHYVPCYRKSDGMIGFYDLVGQEFVFNSVQTYTTKGADV